MKVYSVINAIQAELGIEGIAKTRTNTQGATYKFRGIDDILNVLSPLMAKHGLCILPRVLSRECVERTSKSGGALFFTAVEVEYDFVCTEDGSKHTVKTFGEAMDSSDKSTNKAMSAAYKYAAIQAFAIPTEGDNDTESQTHEVRSQQSLSSNKKIEAQNTANQVITHAQQQAMSNPVKAWVDRINSFNAIGDVARLDDAHESAKKQFKGTELKTVHDAIAARKAFLTSHTTA